MTETTTPKTNGEAIKDRITAPEAAPARRRTGAGAATLAAGAVGMWLVRKYRGDLAAKRRKRATRKHLQVIGRESGAVLRLAGQALGERARQGSAAARAQAGNGATVVNRKAKVQMRKARAKAGR